MYDLSDCCGNSKKKHKNLSELSNADEEKFAGIFNASYEKQALPVSAQSFSIHIALEVHVYVRCSE